MLYLFQHLVCKHRGAGGIAQTVGMALLPQQSHMSSAISMGDLVSVTTENEAAPYLPLSGGDGAAQTCSCNPVMRQECMLQQPGLIAGLTSLLWHSLFPSFLPHLPLQIPAPAKNCQD